MLSRYLKVILDIQEIIHFYNEALNLNQICHLQKTMYADSLPKHDEIRALGLLDKTSPFCHIGDEKITPQGHTHSLLLGTQRQGSLSFPLIQILKSHFRCQRIDSYRSHIRSFIVW